MVALFRSLVHVPRLLPRAAGRALSSTAMRASTPGAPAADPPVLISRYDCKRAITLNRPAALNALTLPMIRVLYPRLQDFESDFDIKMVVLRGAGDKAFCAGGDVRAIVEAAKSNGHLSRDFFREEYKLNHLIGTYEVPFVSIMDGITMGGGVGLSVHGKFRVATERTVFAMPETGIGLFPDVGGSYFLPRLSGELGTYLALTGYRLKGADALHAGIATHYVQSSDVDALFERLTKMRAEQINEQAIGELLREFQKRAGRLNAFSLADQLERIDDAFGADSVEQIVERLGKDGSDWAAAQANTLGAMSPTSLKVTLRQLRCGAEMSFRDVFTMEYRLAQRFVEDGKDFFEGVRAALIDKDLSPKWDPPSLDGVTEDKLDWYFSPLPEDRELHVKASLSVEAGYRGFVGETSPKL